MHKFIRKSLFAALVAILMITAIPLSGASAAGATDPATPPAPGALQKPAFRDIRLELTFAHQKVHVQRIGLEITRSDTLFQKTQKLIDTATSSGKDASAVQSAFDAYKIAFTAAKPYYDQAKSISDAHTGFDASGKITDREQAKTTIKNINETLEKYRTAIGPALKNLNKAVRDFRTANPRPIPTTTP